VVTVDELFLMFPSVVAALTVGVFLMTEPAAASTCTTMRISAPVGFLKVNGASTPMPQVAVFPKLVHGVPPDGILQEGKPLTTVQDSGFHDELTKVVPGGRTSVIVTWLAAFGPRFTTSMKYVRFCFV
jgi:hypothetical protein